MEFRLDQALEVLSQTPATFRSLLQGKSVEWLQARRTPEAFSALDVLGHLMHAELTDWMPRVQMILEHGEARAFEPFDRFGFQSLIADKSIEEILQEFAALREMSLTKLHSLHLAEGDLDRTGVHPEFGRVTLRNLLATWAVHDLTHTAQVVNTMACEYRDAVGPWRAYISILK